MKLQNSAKKMHKFTLNMKNIFPNFVDSGIAMLKEFLLIP